MADLDFDTLTEQTTIEDDHQVALQVTGGDPPRRMTLANLRAGIRRSFAAIATGLNALTGNARLNYDSLRNTPSAADIATLLNALTGAARVSYTALKDVPSETEIFNQSWSASVLGSVTYANLPNLTQAGFDADVADYERLRFEISAQYAGTGDNFTYFEVSIRRTVWESLGTANSFNKGRVEIGRHRIVDDGSNIFTELPLALFRDTNGMTIGSIATNAQSTDGTIKVYGIP